MIEEISENGLVMVGCGFMGQALLEGWLAKSVPREALFVVDPNPSDWLRQQDGINANADLPTSPAAIVIATKPQILDAVLPSLTHLGSANSVVVSIAAGVGIGMFERAFGASTPIVRAMPNLPATIRESITALYYNAQVTSPQKQLVAELFQASGHVIEIDYEQDLHAVTALSDSGPAYVLELDRRIREHRRATWAAVRRREPGHVLVQPDQQRPALAKRRGVAGPVRRAVAGG